MNHFELLERVKDVLIENEVMEANKPIDNFTDLDVSDMEEIDSIELVLDFEEEFNIEIWEHEWDKIKAVEDLLTLIKEKDKL